MAQGLLVLLVGRATKHQQEFQGHEKTYETILRLGMQTDSGDATGTPIRTAAIPAFNRSHVAEVLATFRGRLFQVPPAYSAIKVRGHPAYWWARRHEPVQLSRRPVQISELSLIDCQAQTITFRVECSAGTYVRTLGEAIAERLGTVGHLTALVRLRVGRWSLANAKPLDWFLQSDLQRLAHELLPIPSLPTT